MRKKQKSNKLISPMLIKRAFNLVHTARNQVLKQTNTLMVFTYFHLGRLIVENEQQGLIRAAYGKVTIKELSAQLMKKFGDGFSERNLDQMRLFFNAFKQHCQLCKRIQIVFAKLNRA